jgi:hypothetical protein
MIERPHQLLIAFPFFAPSLRTLKKDFWQDFGSRKDFLRAEKL